MQVRQTFLARRASEKLRSQPGDMSLSCSGCNADLLVPAFEWLYVVTHKPVVRCFDCIPTDLPVVAIRTVPGAAEHVERSCGRGARRRMERDLRRWNGLINARSN